MNNNDENDRSDSDNDSVLSSDMENANVDQLRMRIMHHQANIDLCGSVLDDLKTVKEYINKTVEGTITDEEAAKLEEMKSENRISGLIYKYDEEKSLSENIDKEITQNENRLEYFRGRVAVYEQHADQAEAEEADNSDSNSSAGNVYEVDFDDMDIDSDNEMDVDSNDGDQPHSDENPEDGNNSPDNDESQSPTEYVAELESTLPGDFIGGGDD